MSQENLSADLAIAIAGARLDGMTTVTIARILRQLINLLDMSLDKSAVSNDLTITPIPHSAPMRAAQCL